MNEYTIIFILSFLLLYVLKNHKQNKMKIHKEKKFDRENERNDKYIHAHQYDIVNFAFVCCFFFSLSFSSNNERQKLLLCLSLVTKFELIYLSCLLFYLNNKKEKERLHTVISRKRKEEKAKSIICSNHFVSLRFHKQLISTF